MSAVARAFVFALFGMSGVAGCMPPAGKHVRVATASAAELRAAAQEDNVWYEFEAGDVIPVHLGYLGAMEGGAEGQVVFRAKQRFYFITSKNGPMQISFDGKTFANPQAHQSVIAVIPRKDGKGGELAWMIYVGESGDPEGELKKMLEAAQQQPAQQPATPPAASSAPAESPPATP